MQLHIILSLLIPSFAKGYEINSKSLAFPPPVPFRNASSGYRSAEEDEQCSLDEGVLPTRPELVREVKATKPKKDYS